jgi:hypothetical protein
LKYSPGVCCRDCITPQKLSYRLPNIRAKFSNLKLLKIGARIVQLELVTGNFLEREESLDVHCVGKLVEFRFKAPPGTTSSSITTHTQSGERNYTSCSSQNQKAVTLQPCSGGRSTKSTNDLWWHLRNIYIHIQCRISYIIMTYIKIKLFQLTCRIW